MEPTTEPTTEPEIARFSCPAMPLPDFAAKLAQTATEMGVNHPFVLYYDGPAARPVFAYLPDANGTVTLHEAATLTEADALFRAWKGARTNG